LDVQLLEIIDLAKQKKGFSQNKLAEFFGVSVGDFSDCKTGKQRFNPWQLLQLSEISEVEFGVVVAQEANREKDAKKKAAFQKLLSGSKSAVLGIVLRIGFVSKMNCQVTGGDGGIRTLDAVFSRMLP
jgi:hypothetical protein